MAQFIDYNGRDSVTLSDRAASDGGISIFTTARKDGWFILPPEQAKALLDHLKGLFGEKPAPVPPVQPTLENVRGEFVVYQVGDGGPVFTTREAAVEFAKNLVSVNDSSYSTRTGPYNGVYGQPGNVVEAPVRQRSLNRSF
jgi:hypothetical protein